MKNKILKLIYKELSSLNNTSEMHTSWSNEAGNILITQRHKTSWFWQKDKWFGEMNFRIVFPDGEPDIKVFSNGKAVTVKCGSFEFSLSKDERVALIAQAKNWMELNKKSADKEVEEKIDLRLSKHEINT